MVRCDRPGHAPVGALSTQLSFSSDSEMKLHSVRVRAAIRVRVRAGVGARARVGLGSGLSPGCSRSGPPGLSAASSVLLSLRPWPKMYSSATSSSKASSLLPSITWSALSMRRRTAPRTVSSGSASASTGASTLDALVRSFGRTGLSRRCCSASRSHSGVVHPSPDGAAMAASSRQDRYQSAMAVSASSG
eukprot:scaffold73290_cov36-Phaeocystis_antarctica.AAC.1